MLAAASATQGTASTARPTCDEQCSHSLAYPVGADGAQVYGRVQLLVCFTPEGDADEASIMAPSGHDEIDRAVRAFARAWKREPYAGSGMPPRRCHELQVDYQAAEATEAAEGRISVGWSQEVDGAVALHEPVRCDADCQKAMREPMAGSVRKPASHVVLEVCYTAQGTVDTVKVIESSGQREVDAAAQKRMRTVTIEPDPQGGLAGERCRGMALQP